MILSTPHIQAEISTHGAELTRLVANGRELLWCGDPVFWGRHAPILFPIVGNLAHGVLRINGRKYPMSQHGFARDSEFLVLESEPQQAALALRSSHATLEAYPYDFELQASYAIEGNMLHCSWKVINMGLSVMYYQIGGHPAFYIPGYDPAAELQGYVLLRGDKEREVALLPDTFANDALIFEDQSIDEAVLLDRDRRPCLAVRCPDAQVWGVWAPHKPGCPFVCLEPWRGRKDSPTFRSDISRRKYIQSLLPQASATFEYTIVVSGESEK